MIIWLASYPKSGNTMVRSLLSAYLFTDDGNFNFQALKNISLFPDITFFEKLGVDVSKDDEVVKNYVRAQEEINKKNKKAITFLKTHSTLHEINNHKDCDNLSFYQRQPPSLDISHELKLTQQVVGPRATH